MTDATHLFRGNERGEILDSEGRVVGRILAPSTFDDRTRREDFVRENGQYFCRCGVCGRDFVGLKHRIVCKVCAAPADWSSVAVKVPEPVAFAVESLFDGEQVHRDIYRERAHAERWQQNDGGVVVPLVSLDAILGAK